jgi:hypothetical protein
MAITLQQRAVIGRQWGLTREQLTQLEDHQVCDLWRMNGEDRRAMLTELFPSRRFDSARVLNLRLFTQLAAGPEKPNRTRWGGPKGDRPGRSRPARRRPAAILGQGAA